MDEDAALLRVIAARRRLSADEVVEVLMNHTRYGLELSSQPSPQPTSGTLLLCFKKDLGRIKQDGVAWAKRGSTNKIREDHSKLKASSFVVRSHTCRAAASAEFGRRRYALDVPPPAGDIWLVHYLADTEKSSAAAKSLTAGCGGAVLSGEPALNLARKPKNGVAASLGVPAPVHEPSSHCNDATACSGGAEFLPLPQGGGAGGDYGDCGGGDGDGGPFPGIGSIGTADLGAGWGGAGASNCGSWGSGSLPSSDGADDGAGCGAGANSGFETGSSGGLNSSLFAAGVSGGAFASPMSLDDEFHELAAALAAADDGAELGNGSSDPAAARHGAAVPDGASELCFPLGSASVRQVDLLGSPLGSAQPLQQAPVVRETDGMEIAEGQQVQQPRLTCLRDGADCDTPPSQDVCSLGGWPEKLHAEAAAHAIGGDSGDSAVVSAPPAAILDFSPAWDTPAGGAKVLVCSASPLPPLLPAGFVVMFGEVAVPAEQLTPTALRCRAPPFSTGGGSVLLRLALGPVARPQELPRAIASAADVPPLPPPPPRFEYRAEASAAAAAPAAAAAAAAAVPAAAAAPPPAASLQQPPVLVAPSLPGSGLAKEANGKRLRPQWSSGSGGSGGAASPGGGLSVSSPIAMAVPAAGNYQNGPLLPPSPLLRRPPAAASPQALLGSPVFGGHFGVHGDGIGGSDSSAACQTLAPGPLGVSNGGGIGSPAASPLQARFAAVRPGSGGGCGDAWAEGRQHKIRIVERLGEIAGHSAGLEEARGSGSGNGDGSGVRQPDGSLWRWPRALGQSGSSRRLLSRGGASTDALAAGAELSTGASAGSQASANVEDELSHLLDDAALLDPAIGDAELEELLEQLVIRVVSQLAQLASTDSTLQEELNCLDDSGYGLLHYTCLYSLGALVPVLLACGASVHQPTACGQGLMPLHCAAMGGDLALAQALVQAGAAAGAPDALGAAPAQYAFACGHNEMGWWLLGAAGSASLPPEDEKLLAVAFGAGAATEAAAGGPAAAAANGNGDVMEVQTVDDCGGGGSSSDGWQQEMSEYIAGSENAGESGRGGTSGTPMLVRSGSGQDGLLPCALSSPTLQSSGGSGGSGSSIDSGAGGGAEAGSAAAPSGGGGGGGALAANAGTTKLAKLAPPTTAQMLQDAFASLSLHEKCALTLSSLQQQQQQGGQDAQAAASVAALHGGSNSKRPSSPRLLATPWAVEGDSSANGASAGGGSGGGNSRSGGGGGGGGGSSSDGQDARMLRDVSEVLPVGNEESLRAAMSMMAPSELRALDEEVKVIQGGVRAWLLRRNYRSLRAAAKTLQLAWRERQRGRGGSGGGDGGGGAGVNAGNGGYEPGGGSGRGAASAQEATSGGDRYSGPCATVSRPLVGTAGNAAGASIGDMTSNRDEAATAGAGAISATPVERFMGASAAAGYASGSPRQVQRRTDAANTLQAATRGMLARRRHFARIKRETVALLVIQTNLRSWIRSARPSSGGGSGGGLG